MLYLKYPAQAADQGPWRVALSETAALQLERALLADDDAARRLELQSALAQDAPLCAWALRAAEHRLNRTVNRTEEAVQWLSGCLASELATSLVCEADENSLPEVEWRLPAIVRKLLAYEQALADFRGSLEHEKLESLKELAYGASHEINNPLANIAARAQMLLADEADPERARKLQAIHRQAMRAHEMISDLMLFARPPKLNTTRFDLGQLIAQVVEELQELAEEYDVELISKIENVPLDICADRTQLGVAIRAVAENALEAVAAGGHVTMSVQSSAIDDKDMVEIAIRDDGPGIPDDIRQHIFDPFFSGREAGRGLGFGLSKCWRIVTDHGGQVIVQCPASGGAEFVIQLPIEAGRVNI